MFIPEYEKRFKKDYKLAEKRGLKMDDIKTVMRRLAAGERLEPKYRDHVLKGEYESYGECHIHPDWLLIYLKVAARGAIIFVRTGSHADLFE